MPTLLITGAGRGIGREFVRQYAADGWQIIATVRSEAAAAPLREMGVEVELLDMRDFDAIESFARGFAQPLDLFIANAGITGPARLDGAASARAFQEVLAVNTVAPTLLAELLLPRVAERSGKLVAISSTLGSIAQSSGGWMTYRASKSALNSAWRALALNVSDQPVTLAMLHPGWVRTDMGGAQAEMAVEDSVTAVRRVIGGLERSDSGGFFGTDGERLPW